MEAVFLSSSGWDIGSFLQNAAATLKTWGGYFIILIGVVMVIAAVWQIAKGLMSQGRGQTNWLMVVLLLIIGGAFMAGGFSFVQRIAEGGQKTIEDLGGGGGGGGAGGQTIILPVFLETLLH